MAIMAQRRQGVSEKRLSLLPVFARIVVLGGSAVSSRLSMAQSTSAEKALEGKAEKTEERAQVENGLLGIGTALAVAIDQLGNEKPDIRLQGIFALERIAKDSQKYHWQIMEILTVYVQENSPWRDEAERPEEKEAGKEEESEESQKSKKSKEISPLPNDIQAVVTVIGRRKWAQEEKEDQRLYLARTDLKTANLWGAKLQKADFEQANLREANLAQAKLQKADFEQANLQEADLGGANLQEANLWGANLQETNLRAAKLKRADGLSVDRLCEAFTLYMAELDTELEKQVKKRCSHLLAEP